MVTTQVQRGGGEKRREASRRETAEISRLRLFSRQEKELFKEQLHHNLHLFKRERGESVYTKGQADSRVEEKGDCNLPLRSPRSEYPQQEGHDRAHRGAHKKDREEREHETNSKF